MEGKKWDRWRQIVSSLAVIVGIALVVIELRQASSLIELQMLKQDVDNIDDRLLGTLPENIHEIRQKSIDNPKDLTMYEYRVLDTYFWSITLNRWINLYELAERGLIDRSTWQRAIRQDGVVLAYPFGRAYWQEYKERGIVELPRDMVAEVDALLADAPDDLGLAIFESTLNRLEGDP